MFKCTIWLDAACLSSTLCESEAISQSLRAISAHRSSDMITSPTNQRGKLKAVSHREHLLTGGSGYILANRLPTTSSNRQSKLWYTPITNTRWVTRKAQCYFLFSQHGTIERHKARGLRSKRRGTS